MPPSTNIAIESSKCPLCADNTRRWISVEGTPILRCENKACGFRFFDMENWVSPYSSDDYYSEWQPGKINPSAPWIQARINIIRQCKSTGVAADLGCGIGETAIALGNAGFSAVGVEESQKAINYLKDQYPAIEWRNQSIFEFLATCGRIFDVVTMFHVLEHIPHPQKLVKLIDRALKPDGLVVIEVPDVSGGLARWKGERWDYFVKHHVNYFDVKSLGNLMGSAGYRRQFLQRTYHFSFPQGHRLKDLVKGTLAYCGLNSIIRTAWTK